MSQTKTISVNNKSSDKIGDFLFNENVSFFTCSLLDADVIKSFFADLQKDKDVYCRTIKETFDNDTIYSFLAFRKTVVPTCFDTTVSKKSDFRWKETKIAYLLLVEYKGYLAVCKKNVSLSKNIRNELKNIRYQTLLNFLLAKAKSSIFTKIAMKNLDMSENAMRSKTLESDNLEKSFSPYGTSMYSVSSYRTEIEEKNHSGVYSVALPNSRINKTDEEKQNYVGLIKWIQTSVDRIIGFEKNPNKKRPSGNMLSYFAKTEDAPADLECDSILITKESIKNLIEEDDSLKIICKNVDGVDKEIPKKEINEFIDQYFILYENFDEKNFVKRENDTFIIQIENLQNVYIQTENKIISVNDFVVQNQSYVLSFKNSLLRYSQGTFFDTSSLIPSIPIFKKLFEGCPELNKAKNEKGDFKEGQEKFEDSSIFFATEKIYKNQYKYFICDDLGIEYADHIGIVDSADSSPSVAFFVEKASCHVFSASAFQVVVSQAQKNIGNFILNPNQKNRITDKCNPSKKTYQNKGAKTKISRSDCDITEAVNTWLEISKSPFLKKQLFIVVNFITPSKVSEVFDTFEEKEKNERSVENYNIGKQMLWLLASLHNFCIEHNVELKIICPDKIEFKKSEKEKEAGKPGLDKPKKVSSKSKKKTKQPKKK